MIVLRLCLRAALLCLAGPLLQPGKIAAQTVLSPEVQRRIERVAACLTTPVVAKDDPHACQTLRIGWSRITCRASALPSFIMATSSGRRDLALSMGGAPVPPRLCSRPAVLANRSPRWPRFTLSSKASCRSTRTSISSSPRGGFPPARPLRDAWSRCASCLITPRGSRCTVSWLCRSAPIPTLVQILNGEQPANTDPVRLEAPTGSRWKSSGGGYTVMQQLLIDVSHERVCPAHARHRARPDWHDAQHLRTPIAGGAARSARNTLSTRRHLPSRAALTPIPKWRPPDYGQLHPTSRASRLRFSARCAAMPIMCFRQR